MAIDFFTAQERARRLSGWLVALFAAAVVMIALITYFVLAVVMLPPGEVWDAGLFLATVSGTGLVVLGASAIRSSGLRSGGGAAVGEMLGGRLLPPDTVDSDERRLLNVVEEMALAAGTPVPAVYLLDGEEAINAFAAGYSPEDAVVGFTRGAMKTFSRDELQAVAAHEFSHILNRDIRLNIRLTGLLFGILALGLGGRMLLRASFYAGGGRRDGRAVAAMVAVGLTLFVAGYVGVLVGRVIRAGVSRQREFLADAAAVQFTRNPDGMAGALKKIGAAGSGLESSAAEEVSHFFFANGMQRGLLAGLWATHPPLVDRIRRIDRHFDGDFSQVRLEPVDEPSRPADRPRVDSHIERLAAAAGLAGAVGAVQPDAPAASPVERESTSGLPSSLLRAAHDPLGAVALTYALILDRDAGARRAQLDVLEERLVPALRGEVLRLVPDVDRLRSDVRLALVDIAAPSLRMLSDPQAQKLIDVLGELAEADRRLSIFEFALKTAVRHRLAVTHGRAKGTGRGSPGGVDAAAAVVLAALALVGSDDPAASREAFRAGAAILDMDVGADLPACTSDDVRHSLDVLSEAGERARARLLEACVQTVLHDQEARSEERYLLRAVAAAVDVSLPAHVFGESGPQVATGLSALS